MAHEDLKKLAEVKTFNAYYFSLNGTGCEPVDAVLAAIARAGKDSHHTSYWDETYGNGVSHVQKIQEAANQAASAIAALQQEVEVLREQLERAKNWKRLVMECENLLGKQYRDNKGHFYTFFGLVHSNDDYYYGMWRPGEMNLLSCVGSMETHGFELVAALEDGEAKP